MNYRQLARESEDYRQNGDFSMAFEGSCHCGKVAYEVDADLPTKAVLCNCSNCTIKGMIVDYFPAAQFRLTRGDEALLNYRFNTHVIEHRFCGTCGVELFGQAEAPDGAPMKGLNLRCVKALDLDALELEHVDGASSPTGARPTE
jgi:hypothetical protein